MLSSPVYAKLHPRPLASHQHISSSSFRRSKRSNLQKFQRSNDLGFNSFTFTSLAAPHPLTPIESHPYKNHRGEGVPFFSLGHQIPAAPLFSYTYELPIFYPLCFACPPWREIHPSNGGGRGSSMRFLKYRPLFPGPLTRAHSPEIFHYPSARKFDGGTPVLLQSSRMRPAGLALRYLRRDA